MVEMRRSKERKQQTEAMPLREEQSSRHCRRQAQREREGQRPGRRARLRPAPVCSPSQSGYRAIRSIIANQQLGNYTGGSVLCIQQLRFFSLFIPFVPTRNPPNGEPDRASLPRNSEESDTRERSDLCPGKTGNKEPLGCEHWLNVREKTAGFAGRALTWL